VDEARTGCYGRAMSILPILRYPDPRLAQPCAAVGEVTDDIRRLAGDMLETMYAAPGRGLAAPQVGVLLRLFVMDVAGKDGAPEPLVFVNPEIVEASGGMASRAEGCLSIPGLMVEVARPEAVRMRWTGLDGAERQAWFAGIAATCAQHESDHLDGVLTLDRIAPEARAAALAEYAG